MAILIETCPKCGHDLVDLIIATYPPIPRKECWNCGWSWEGKQEEVVRVPFGDNANNKTTVTTLETFELPTFETLENCDMPCDRCATLPKNGGNGHCNCVLNIPKIAC